MAHGAGFATARWVAAKNDGTIEIPPYSVVRITGLEYGDYNAGSSPIITTVARPTSDNQLPLGVTGPTRITGEATCGGLVAVDGMAIVKLEAAPTGSIGTPNWGTQENSFYPLEHGVGLRTMYVDQTNLYALVAIGVDLANLQEIAAPEHVIALEEDGSICKSPYAGLSELMLAEDHPGKGIVFKCYQGIWCSEDHTWRYDCTDTCDDWVWAIDHRYDVPYPDIGARGLFTPRASDTYGTIWECVALDCSSPGACADQDIDQPCPGSASTNYGGAC